MSDLRVDKVKVLIALVTVQLLFAINYVVSKTIVAVFPPLVWGSFRNLIAALGLLILAVLFGGKRPVWNRGFYIPLICYAFLGVILNQASFLMGLKYTTATNSAILNTLIPIFTLLFVTISGKEPLTPRRAMGFFSALVGVLIIRKIENFSWSDQTLIGDALTILNCISYALFLTLSRNFVRAHDPLWITASLFIVGSLGLTAFTLPHWIEFHWPALTLNLILCMVFSIFGCTLLAYLLNLWALARTQSSSVALFIYLQPVVTSFLAWMWLGEVVTIRTLVASFLIFVGMICAL